MFYYFSSIILCENTAVYFELRVYEVLYMSCFLWYLTQNKCPYNKPLNFNVAYADNSLNNDIFPLYVFVGPDI